MTAGYGDRCVEDALCVFVDYEIVRYKAKSYHLHIILCAWSFAGLVAEG